MVSPASRLAARHTTRSVSLRVNSGVSAGHPYHSPNRWIPSISRPLGASELEIERPMRWIALHEQFPSGAAARSAVRSYRRGELKGPFPTEHRFRALVYKYSIIAQRVIGRDNFGFPRAQSLVRGTWDRDCSLLKRRLPLRSSAHRSINDPMTAPTPEAPVSEAPVSDVLLADSIRALAMDAVEA